ncbi:unnamed protein product, partial [Prorocentrum cordatum]
MFLLKVTVGSLLILAFLKAVVLFYPMVVLHRHLTNVPLSYLINEITLVNSLEMVITEPCLMLQNVVFLELQIYLTARVVRFQSLLTFITAASLRLTAVVPFIPMLVNVLQLVIVELFLRMPIVVIAGLQFYLIVKGACFQSILVSLTMVDLRSLLVMSFWMVVVASIPTANLKMMDVMWYMERPGGLRA